MYNKFNPKKTMKAERKFGTRELITKNLSQNISTIGPKKGYGKTTRKPGENRLKSSRNSFNQ